MVKVAPSDTGTVRGFGKTPDEKIEERGDHGFRIGPFGSSSLIPNLLKMPGITCQNEFFIKDRTMKKMQGACDQIGTSPECIKNLPDQEGFAPRFDAGRGYENKVDASCTGYSIDADAFEKPAFDHCRSVERKSKISGYISSLANLRRNSFEARRDASIQIVSIAQPPAIRESSACMRPNHRAYDRLSWRASHGRIK